jgi:hypothetical protein
MGWLHSMQQGLSGLVKTSISRDRNGSKSCTGSDFTCAHEGFV